MKDNYGRVIDYLRLSVTDKCNLRCMYCMPEDGVKKLEHIDVLTNEEIINICEVAVSLGIKKIRVTGGEPLVRKGIIDILENIKMIKGLNELCLTTNGVLLSKYINDLKRVGVDRLNISLDTLAPTKYKKITRLGDLDVVKKGIDEALGVGFKKIKINTVLIGGFNDDEIEKIVGLTYDYDIDVRFIELMPMTYVGFFDEKSYIKGDEVLKKFKNYEQIESGRSVAKLYKLNGAKGNFGIITPVSNHFCKECSRLRVTFDGKIKPCLHSSDEINIKGLSKPEMIEKFKEAIMKKPESHDTLDAVNRSKANRDMNRIGG